MPRRGRPRKFTAPSRAVTLTLPENVLAALDALDHDLSRAVVRIAQPELAKRPHPPAEVATFGRRGVIVVNPEPDARGTHRHRAGPALRWARTDFVRRVDDHRASRAPDSGCAGRSGAARGGRADLQEHRGDSEDGPALRRCHAAAAPHHPARIHPAGETPCPAPCAEAPALNPLVTFPFGRSSRACSRGVCYLVTQTTTVLGLIGAFALSGAAEVRAQQPSPSRPGFINVNVGAQPQRRTIADVRRAFPSTTRPPP